METQIVLELEKNPKLHEYLLKNSVWYVYLNRDIKKLDELKKQFKEYKRNTTINKFDKTIDNIELLTDIMKIV